MNDDLIIRKIQHGILKNDHEYVTKSLWRLSSGDRKKAFEIIRSTASHYGVDRNEIKDFHIDIALGNINDGVEIEWLTDGPIDYLREEKEAVDNGDPVPFIRTSGELICKACHLPYYKHSHAEYKDFDGNLWLRRLCSGQLIKL